MTKRTGWQNSLRIKHFNQMLPPIICHLKKEGSKEFVLLKRLRGHAKPSLGIREKDSEYANCNCFSDSYYAAWKFAADLIKRMTRRGSKSN